MPKNKERVYLEIGTIFEDWWWTQVEEVINIMNGEEWLYPDQQQTSLSTSEFELLTSLLRDCLKSTSSR